MTSPEIENQGLGDDALNTVFGQHSRRAAQLRTETHGKILEISDSAFKHLTLSTVSALARMAERHTDALEYFPEGSRLYLTAAGDRGDYIDSGYLNVYCELRYPGENGGVKSSGREEVYRSSGGARGVEAAFENFLQMLKHGALDSDRGVL